MKVALCDFKEEVGWRVRGVSQSDFGSVRLFRFGSIKLLIVPINSPVRPGNFCNPRRMLCL